jgi:hypothetical protein
MGEGKMRLTTERERENLIFISQESEGWLSKTARDKCLEFHFLICNFQKKNPNET